MRFGKILAAAAALSLTASPVLAQSAASLSLGSTARASVSESNELEGGFIIPLLAVVAVILAVVVIADSGDDAPTSP